MATGGDAAGIPEVLHRVLPPGIPVCVAFSGGRDSTVLLHAAAMLRERRSLPLRALHVDHGLQASSAGWARACVATAALLGVECEVVTVRVGDVRGRGVEAAAREARYAALRGRLRPGEWLLTAHHADDQAETVLRHLLRGSGVAGAAGIPARAPFGSGQLCRPLLDVPGSAVAAYASGVLAAGGIHWIDDPMNADPDLDRSFLRHEVMPVLRRRFPAAAGALARSAGLAAEAAGLLDVLARQDAAAAVAGERVAVAALRALDEPRQRNLLRWLVRERGWATPPERRLRTGLAQLLSAAPGRQPVLRWGVHEIRRYRDHLHLLEHAVGDPAPAEEATAWDGARVDLGAPRGVLALVPGREEGPALSAAAVAAGLAIAFRSGGERVRPEADRHHRTLKYLFQSLGVVPWMRGQVPLVLAAGRLAAVADLWVADWAAAPAARGYAIDWRDHAAIR